MPEVTNTFIVSLDDHNEVIRSLSRKHTQNDIVMMEVNKRKKCLRWKTISSSFFSFFFPFMTIYQTVKPLFVAFVLEWKNKTKTIRTSFDAK
jgi:hypothetical protein